MIEIVCYSSCTFCVCVSRSEEGGQHLPHAETPPHCGAAGDVQLGWDALHGFRVVSLSLAGIPRNMTKHAPRVRNLTPAHTGERKMLYL